MRWIPKRPHPNDSRVVRKFLWLPLFLQGETRWLEFAYVFEIYSYVFRGRDNKQAHYFWQPVKWASAPQNFEGNT